MNKIIMLLASLSIWYACDTHTTYHSYHPLPVTGWKKSDTLFFNIPVNDSLSTYRIFIEIRHNDFYPYQDLYLGVSQNGVDSVILTDTLKCVLADKKGKWKGNGLGSLYQSTYFYASRRFPTKGIHIFSISQAMTDSLLKGVNNVGMKIIKE